MSLSAHCEMKGRFKAREWLTTAAKEKKEHPEQTKCKEEAITE
jgi:hypothetical protein